MTAERELPSLDRLPALYSREHERISADEFKPWPNSLRGFLTKISTFPNGSGKFAPKGFELELDNGIIIDLPPTALVSVKHLKVGDQFEIMPTRGEIEGKIVTEDRMVTVNVSRVDIHQVSFGVDHDAFRRKSLNPQLED